MPKPDGTPPTPAGTSDVVNESTPGSSPGGASGSTLVPAGDTVVPGPSTVPAPSTAPPPAGSTAPPAGSTAPPAGSTVPPAGSTAPPAPASTPAPGATAPGAVAAATVAADGVDVPARIGEYLVRRLLGEGGMGKVYEAEERLSKRRVALKVLRPELSRSEHGRRLFLNEMTILAHLDHEHVVRCLACQEQDGELVMVLELLDGPTLREVLATRGRLPWTEAVTIAAQIAAGLGAAHGQTPPIVHRDLKPDNVALTPGRSGGAVVKVMDFGIAKVLEALSSTTTHSVGTLQYMSPEQIDAGDIGPRTDLYSLGLVLYEMLAGRPPFESPSPRELLNLQCTEEPPPLPPEVRAGLPRGVEAVLTSLLHKKPENRPESAQAVLQALDPFVSAGDLALVGPPAATPATVPPVQMAAVAEASAGASASAPAGGKAKVARPVMPADTIGIVQRAGGPRQVSGPLAIGIILALSLAAGLATYLVRTGHAKGASPASGEQTSAVAATVRQS